MGMKEAALWYFDHGFKPIPLCFPDENGKCGCGRNHTSERDIGKAPLVGKGYHKRKITRKMVENWWTKWPNANIGILIHQSDLAVIDIDSEDAHVEAVQKWSLGNVATAVASSGKGYHYYFRNTTGIKMRACHIGESQAIDLLTRGYIVVPPSKHRSGNQYEWVKDPKTLSNIPESVARELRAIMEKRKEEEKKRVELPDKLPKVDVHTLKIGERLRKDIVEGAPSGQRSELIFSVVNRLMVAGLKDEEIASILLNPEYGISEKPLERRNPVSYVEQQISKARASFDEAKVKRNKFRVVDGKKERKKDGEPDDRLPVIVVNDRQERDIRRDAWNAILKANAQSPKLFRQNGTCMAVQKRDDGTLEMKAINEQQMRELLSEVADFMRVKVTKYDIDYIPARVPDFLYKTMVHAPDERIPAVKGMVYTPIFTENGKLLNKAGYDPTSRYYYYPLDGAEIPEVSEKPSESEVRDAVDFLLNNLFIDFPFKNYASRMNALAALLVNFCRDMIKGQIPLHLIDAPAAGTGKTLLAKVIGLVATGRIPSMASLSKKEEEIEKRLVALLMTGDPIHVLDNATDSIESEHLNRMLTSEQFTGRILGKSQTVTLDNTAVWFMTGNNVNVEGDVSRRIVWIRLDAEMPNPYLRKEFVHPDILQWVRDNRPQLIHACLTIIQNWIAKGKPLGKEHMASFESYALTMGGILSAAGLSGFLENRNEMIERASEETNMWKAFFDFWFKEKGTEPVTMKEVYKLATASELLYPVLGDGSANSHKTRLRKALKKLQDMVIGDYKLRIQYDPKYNQNCYKLEI
jgi:hypothetical protein